MFAIERPVLVLVLPSTVWLWMWMDAVQCATIFLLKFVLRKFRSAFCCFRSFVYFSLVFRSTELYYCFIASNIRLTDKHDEQRRHRILWFSYGKQNMQQHEHRVRTQQCPRFMIILLFCCVSNCHCFTSIAPGAVRSMSIPTHNSQVYCSATAAEKTTKL